MVSCHDQIVDFVLPMFRTAYALPAFAHSFMRATYRRLICAACLTAHGCLSMHYCSSSPFAERLEALCKQEAPTGVKAWQLTAVRLQSFDSDNAANPSCSAGHHTEAALISFLPSAGGGALDVILFALLWALWGLWQWAARPRLQADHPAAGDRAAARRTRRPALSSATFIVTPLRPQQVSISFIPAFKLQMPFFGGARASTIGGSPRCMQLDLAR